MICPHQKIQAIKYLCAHKQLFILNRLLQMELLGQKKYISLRFNVTVSIISIYMQGQVKAMIIPVLQKRKQSYRSNFICSKLYNAKMFITTCGESWESL